MHTRVVFFLVLVCCLTLSCDKSPTGPEPFKDPRTYTWTIDTLAYPGSFQTTMTDIWGSSPTDVYVVGHNDGGFGKMFHFDGTRWTDVKLNTLQGGAIAGAIDLSAMYGFAANDIWAVGERIYTNYNPPPNFLDSSLIMHYDGVQWRELKVTNGRFLNDVWGKTTDDLWVCGWAGTLFHYDGRRWEKDSVSVYLPPGGFFQLTLLRGVGSDLYMLGSTFENDLARITDYFFRRQSQTWTLVDSFVISPQQARFKWGAGDLWVSPARTLFSAGTGGVFRWTGSNWVNVFPHPTSLRSIIGTSEQNMFVVGDFGKFYHYNGSDWSQFKQFEDMNVVYSGVWTDGREAFVVGFTNDGQMTIILHGK